MPDRRFYFAYGSNLDAAQMKRRCPGCDVVGPAFLPGFALSFPVHSGGDWRGGVASVEMPDTFKTPSRRDEPHLYGSDAHGQAGVWGVVYRVTEEDLASLDVYEAVAEGMYVRGLVDVRLEGEHTPIALLTYFAVRGYNAPQPPSRRYRQTIADGAEAHGLPAAYVAGIRALPTVD